jgi:hypothetical protein
LAVVLDVVADEVERVAWPASAHDAAHNLLEAIVAAAAAARSMVSELTDAAATAFAHQTDLLASASMEMRAALSLPGGGAAQNQPRPDRGRRELLPGRLTPQ